MFEKILVDYKGLMLFTGGGVPMFELLVTPARAISKTWNLVSIEDICRATGRKILKEIRRENFEKSIVEKGSVLPTNDHIETGTHVRAAGYPCWGVWKRRNLVSIEGIYRAASKNLFKEVRREKFEKSLQRAHALHWRWGTQVRAPGYPS